MRVDVLGKIVMMCRRGPIALIGSMAVVGMRVMRVMRVGDRNIAMLRFVIVVSGFRMIVWNELADIQDEQDGREIQPTGAC
jgi:hypothetical protein